MKSPLKRILVTGGAGFIGSWFIQKTLKQHKDVECLVNLDLLTYAADLANLEDVKLDPRYLFVKGDICDEPLVDAICGDYRIDTIVHFAAESHVDKSIEGPISFCRANVEGTMRLLEVVRKRPNIYFHHVSTDEVYGSLQDVGSFTEDSPLKPRSPYAASKAASDHFVYAYTNTYDLKTTISHCSNNFGPAQHREKLIPLMLFAMMEKKRMPLYGSGGNIRDWLYVEDHVDAIWAILRQGRVGEVYDIGGGVEMSNLQMVSHLIEIFSLETGEDPMQISQRISFVKDRPGHDFRYSIDSSKICRELQWSASHCFADALRKTVRWYLQRHKLSTNIGGIHV